jgi:hypothetical protein
MSGSKVLPSTTAGAGAVSAPVFSQEESPAYKKGPPFRRSEAL